MIASLLLATVLTLADPAGDAVGGGQLVYPTAEVFRAPGTLDALELAVPEREGFAFNLRLAQVTNPWNLPHGFSLPIVELYVNTREEGGLTALLPGSGMRLPDGATWHYAFRLTGESLELWRARPDGRVEDITGRYDVGVTLTDTTLTVTSTLPRPRHFSLYGVVGGYDPWDRSRWRRVMPEAEAFAFGSPQQAATGIRAVDVLADSPEAQAGAIQSGVLPEIRPLSRQAQWPPVIAAGFLLTLLGLAGRIYLGYLGRRAANRADRSCPSIGYGSQPLGHRPPDRKPQDWTPQDQAPSRRLEPVDLLAALPPRGGERGGAPRGVPAEKPELEEGKGLRARTRVRVYPVPLEARNTTRSATERDTPRTRSEAEAPRAPRLEPGLDRPAGAKAAAPTGTEPALPEGETPQQEIRGYTPRSHEVPAEGNMSGRRLE